MDVYDQNYCLFRVKYFVCNNNKLLHLLDIWINIEKDGFWIESAVIDCILLGISIFEWDKNGYLDYFVLPVDIVTIQQFMSRQERNWTFPDIVL